MATRLSPVLLVIVLFSGVATAQAPSLGDPVTYEGVEVRGFGQGDRALRIQHRHDVRISLGPGRASRRGAHTTVHVCGVDARRTEVETPGVPSVRVWTPQLGRSAHLITPDRPPTTYVYLEIPRGDRWVRIEWVVPSARRERWRALEEAFFASVRCVD